MTKQELINQASEAHNQYPQYKGHWDGQEWRLAVVTQNIKTKAGIAFKKGDLVIAKSPFANEIFLNEYHTAYSFRNRIDTSIHYSALRYVGEVK